LDGLEGVFLRLPQCYALHGWAFHPHAPLQGAYTGTLTRLTGGLPLFKWADIDVAPRNHVEKGIQGERRSIVNDCFALAMKRDHYNATHPHEEPLQVIFNFEEDIEEMKIAKGLDGEAA
jgi:hypothetical protein